MFSNRLRVLNFQLHKLDYHLDLQAVVHSLRLC